MSQLLKIVLIDSLCAGAKAEIAISGNTSVNGTNGIGKSSFLKLIPVFYGSSRTLGEERVDSQGSR